jgi:hypothetical protein
MIQMCKPVWNSHIPNAGSAATLEKSQAIPKVQIWEKIMAHLSGAGLLCPFAEPSYGEKKTYKDQRLKLWKSNITKLIIRST